jgi:predicted phage-related endonuclease
MQGVERIKVNDHSAWLELRKRDVTASTVGALFDVHPYLTIAGLHALKCGFDLGGPDPESAIIRRGLALEQVVADEVAKLRPGWQIVKATEYLRDVDVRLGATPDFYIRTEDGRRGVLQTKVVEVSKYRKEWQENGAPPLWISLQALQESMLDGADFGAVGALAIGSWAFDCEVYEISRNEHAEKRIRQGAARFWADLDAGKVPELDYKRDGDIIAALYPMAEPGKVIDLSADNRMPELLGQRELQKTIAKEAKTTLEEIEAEIKAKLGDAEAAIVRGWKSVTLKNQHRAGYTVKEADFRVLRATREQAQ